ncbi:transposase [Eubacterium ramulus]
MEKDAEKNKVMKTNEQWKELKERFHANIQSERGILKRQTRSIQTEGHFGDSRKTRTSGTLTTVRQIRYIKNSCYMPLPEI